MKSFVFTIFIVCLSVVAGSAQDSPASSPTPTTTAQAPDRTAIDATLQSYVKAYALKKVDDLVAIWPDLPNQKKDYNKIKSDFDNPNISAMQMSIQPLQTQSIADSAVVEAQRNLQYVKEETRSESVSGDLRGRGIVGVQDQGPLVKTVKKNVKKSDKIWIKLHKTGDNWTIASISEKPQVP